MCTLFQNSHRMFVVISLWNFLFLFSGFADSSWLSIALVASMYEYFMGRLYIVLQAFITITRRYRPLSGHTSNSCGGRQAPAEVDLGNIMTDQ